MVVLDGGLGEVQEPDGEVPPRGVVVLLKLDVEGRDWDGADA